MGARDELPPKELGELVKKVQFHSFDRVRSQDLSRFAVVVISVSASYVLSDVDVEWLSELSGPKFLVLADTYSLSPVDYTLINSMNFEGIHCLPSRATELAAELRLALESAADPIRSEGEKAAIANLENEYTDLESLAKVGTEHIASAKREIELKVLRVRKLIRFLEQLSTLHSIDEFLRLLRQEFKEFHHVKDPVLVIGAENKPTQVHYFQGAQVLRKTAREHWPLLSHARFNDLRDSQYLANLFSRPFARLFSIPISIRGGSTDEPDFSSGVLYFEHALSDSERQSFVTYFEERLHLIGVALDRLFLESDLREASLLWERTFDEIADPVAIFDDDKNLVRSNKAFQSRLAGLTNAETFGDSIHYNGRTFEIRRYPIQGADGEYSTNVVIHYLDVTLSHQLQKQMIQQEKMAALGHLAGNIAHELNNPLTGIQSMAQILVQRSDLDHQIRGDLQEVEAAALRCQKIIKNLLDFSRGAGEQELTKIELNEVVQRTLPLLKTLVGMHELELDLTEDANTINVEPQLFQQVVFNLIKNACQAMVSGGRLELQTASNAMDKKVMLRVIDSGPGMSDEVQSQIFDYFFTTKPQGEGTGLGLSMSRSIVKRFGGEITVKSDIGQGSIFTVEMPLAGEL